MKYTAAANYYLNKFGGRGGTRTLKAFGQRILSPPRIPIPPLARSSHFSIINNMKQIFIIHGGQSFSSYSAYISNLKSKSIEYECLKYSQRWREWIAQNMPRADVLLPNMPSSDNAQYEEWKIYFEKMIPFFRKDVQLVGHSLGAMFLAKYLQNYPLSHPLRRLILIAGVYDKKVSGESNSFLPLKTDRLYLSAQEIHLFHSEDDQVVPYTELAKFQADLPSAITHSFIDRGHFIDPTFPELLKILKQK